MSSRTLTLWGFLAGLCAGALIAFPLSAPILGAVLPDSAATLWGAALGAAMAVAGSMLAVRFQEDRRRRDALALIVEMVQPIAFHLDELSGFYGLAGQANNGQEPEVITSCDWNEVRDAAAHLLGRIELIHKRTNRIDSVLPALGANWLKAYFWFETELEAIEEISKRVLNEASQPGAKMYPKDLKRNGWTALALTVHRNDINSTFKRLKTVD